MNQIKTELDSLKKAQETDRELYLAQEQLKEFPVEREALKQKLDSEKAHLKEFEGALKVLQLKQKDKELELGQKEAQIKKFDGQLAQVKTNKEYSALQQEIASLKADNSLLEEDIIKIMDEVEAAHDEVRKEGERIKQKEKEFAVREAEVKEKEKQLKDDIEAFKKQREELLSHVKPEIRMLYDAVVLKRQGIALAKVAGEICGACKMKIRAQILNEVMMGENLVACEQCHRFLYIE